MQLSPYGLKDVTQPHTVTGSCWPELKQQLLEILTRSWTKKRRDNLQRPLVVGAVQVIKPTLMQLYEMNAQKPRFCSLVRFGPVWTALRFHCKRYPYSSRRRFCQNATAAPCLKT